MGNKCCSGTGKAGKTKEVVEDREVKQVVCEELCVTKLYVKDGVWQSGVKDGVWKKVCQRWCVKDGVWQSAATCRQVPRLPRKKPRRPRRHLRTRRATRASPVPYVPRLPRETKVDVSKCHACHAKCSYMSPSATPATQKAAASTATAGNRARHQSQPSAIRAMPATWNEGGCLKVPRLPRKVQLHVAKCHTCHAKSRGVHGDCWEPSAPPEPAQCHTCHACHVKRRWMSQSARPATWNEGGCLKVPHLPRKVQLHVAKCRACHAKSRGVHGDCWEPSAPPEPAQCHTWHACHVRRRWMSQSATPATQSAATCRQAPCLPRKKPRRPRATPATWNEGGCLKVPRLPRKKCASCVWVSCVCASCVWVSCVWVSCVWVSCEWVSCVCVQVLCE